MHSRRTKLLLQALALLKLDPKAELRYERFKHAMLGETRKLVGREKLPAYDLAMREVEKLYSLRPQPGEWRNVK